jgi:oligosaccharyltransferase complex subunit epsilon
MAPKKNAAARPISPAPPTAAAAATSPATTTTTATTSAAAATTPKTPTANKTVGTGAQSWDSIVNNLLAHYVETTPQRTKLVDAFMAFLVAVGALQFVYCVVAGNYVRFFF